MSFLVNLTLWLRMIYKVGSRRRGGLGRVQMIRVGFVFASVVQENGRRRARSRARSILIHSVRVGRGGRRRGQLYIVELIGEPVHAGAVRCVGLLSVVFERRRHELTVGRKVVPVRAVRV